MIREEEELERLVVFAILMENGKGILNKSPKYISEKFHSVMDVLYPHELLDVSDKRKRALYYEKWIFPKTEAQK